MYSASALLIEVLQKNKLRKKNYIYNPMYGGKYPINNPSYSPAKHKMAFGMGKGKAALVLFFDYTIISVSERGIFLTEKLSQLSDIQLRSIITYFLLPYHRRKTIRVITGSRIETCGEVIQRMSLTGQGGEYPFDKKYMQIFNGCKL